MWVTPENIRTAFKHVYFSQVGAIGFPKKIFINKDFQPILEKALNNLIDRGLAHELKTWDGCFMLRTKRGLTSLSIHAWANAVDVNRAENDLNMTPKLSPEFVKCFTDAGAEWGGTWKRKDGMHFQIAKL
ncbi:M15 family metallopeptidase [Flavobacterium psychrophilum]|nr:M15 family metallopeptidase [Flavobacterium psychrophilum]